MQVSQEFKASERVAPPINEIWRDGALFSKPRADRAIDQMASENLSSVAEGLRRLVEAQRLDLRPPVAEQVFVDRNSGIAHIEPYIPATFYVLQDCYDPEAQLRQSVHWQLLGPRNGEVIVHPIPEFRPTAIGGAIVHYLGELDRNGARARLFGSGTYAEREVVYSELPMVFIANTAPRTGKPEEHGAPFIYARLGYNIFYFGTNSEELGPLKNFLIGNPREVIIDDCPTYRSRYLGTRVAEWRAGDISHFGGEVSASLIPETPRGTILFVDNFGNVKLNLTGRELEQIVGPLANISSRNPVWVRVRLGDSEVRAQVVVKLEDGVNDALLLAVGSSRANMERDPLSHSADFYLKGNPNGSSAAQEFMRMLGLPVAPGTPRHLLPLPGMRVQLEAERA